MKATRLKITEIQISGQPFYQVTFPILPKGRGRRTFKEKQEAQTFHDLKAIEIRNQGLASATFSERQRGEYLDALEMLKPYSIGLREALEIALPHLAARGRTAAVSVAVERLLASKRGEGRSSRYLLDLSSRLNGFAAVFGTVSISALSVSDIEGWLASLPVAAQTRNNNRRVVGTLFEYANRMGWREGQNPALAVPLAKVTRNRPSILTATELSALLTVADAEILPALAIGALAGLRRAEIERLDWHDVKLTRGFIDVGAEKAKTGRRRLVPICKALTAWLASYAQERGRVAPTTFRYNELFGEARKAAGLKDRWEGNELRHSYASARLAELKNAALVAEEMGNSVQIIRSHYAEVLTLEEATAYFAVSPQAPANVVNIRAA